MATKEEIRAKWRERRNRYFRRHREQVCSKRRESFDSQEEHERHVKSNEYILARKALRALCRPDAVAMGAVKQQWEEMDPSSLKLPDAEVAVRDLIYKRALRKLRIIHGRNPDTGWLLDREESPS